MQPKRDAKWIGVFVIGGIILLLAGIVAFSSTGWFSRQMNFVVYFDSSLNGLEVGSPVSFRGVDIGKVTNIVMEFDPSHQQVNTPVYLEIDPQRFKVSSFSDQISLLADPPMKKMVEKGLRAQLQTKSWITGQRFIELEFHPTYPARFRADKGSKADEIPTIPSQLDQVQETLKNVLASVQKLDLQELVTEAVLTVETTRAAAYEFYSMAHKVNEQIDTLLANANSSTEESTARLKEMKKTLNDISGAAEKVAKMAGNLDSEIRTISPNITKGANNATSAFDQMALAMRALKELAELLERNPDALLTGKQKNAR